MNIHISFPEQLEVSLSHALYRIPLFSRTDESMITSEIKKTKARRVSDSSVELNKGHLITTGTPARSQTGHVSRANLIRGADGE